MNRRDAALIAHLDAIESRITALFTATYGEISARLDRQSDLIAGLRMELLTHRHEGEE